MAARTLPPNFNYIKVHTAKAAFTVNDSLSFLVRLLKWVFTNTSLYYTSYKMDIRRWYHFYFS